MKDRVKQYIPSVDTGTFIIFKDTVKQAAVKSDYKILKELKDVLTDRTQSEICSIYKRSFYFLLIKI